MSGSINYVKARVIARNATFFPTDTPVIEPVLCSSTIRVAEWWVPQFTTSGYLTGYANVIDQGTKPTPDSIKTIRMTSQDVQQEVWVHIADDKDKNFWAEMCAECCGNPAEMPTVVIPELINEAHPCPETPAGTPTYTFLGPIPVNDNDLPLFLSHSYNGEYGVAFPEAGVADPAALLAWVQANEAGKGTWTLEEDDTLLKLVSTVVLDAMLNVTLVPAVYCLELPAVAADVDGINVGGVTTTFPLTSLDRTNAAAVFAQLEALGILVGEFVIVEDAPVVYYQYTGLQEPISLKEGASVVVSFTAGACV